MAGGRLGSLLMKAGRARAGAAAASAHAPPNLASSRGLPLAARGLPLAARGLPLAPLPARGLPLAPLAARGFPPAPLAARSMASFAKEDDVKKKGEDEVKKEIEEDKKVEEEDEELNEEYKEIEEDEDLKKKRMFEEAIQLFEVIAEEHRAVSLLLMRHLVYILVVMFITVMLCICLVVVTIIWYVSRTIEFYILEKGQGEIEESLLPQSEIEKSLLPLLGKTIVRLTKRWNGEK